MKANSFRTKVGNFVKLLGERAKDADINNYSIVIAYYSLLAIFPLFILVGSAVRIFHIKTDMIMEYLAMIMPQTVLHFLKPFIESFLQTGSGSLASITGLITLWAASRGINAIKLALNNAFGMRDTQRYLTSRIFSMFLTIGLGALILIIFVLFSFGQMVLDYITPRFNLPLAWLETFVKLKTPTTFLAMFLVITIMYFVVPNCRVHLRCVIPGSLIATIGWMVLSQGFSLYVKYFTRSVMAYGTIGTFIVLMFWLNYSAWVIIFGAVIGAAIEYYFYKGVKIKRNTLRVILKKSKQKVSDNVVSPLRENWSQNKDQHKDD